MSRVLDGGMTPVFALSETAWYNIGLVVVVAALILAAVLAYRVYGEVNEDVEPASPDELLAAFEKARFEGELDEEEFERVRQRFDSSVPRPPRSIGPKKNAGPAE